MDERRRQGQLVAAVLLILLLTWLGFFIHRSPRFPGSGLGTAIGSLAAALMLLPLAYSIAKRIRGAGARLQARLPMKTWLAVHLYAGLAGAVLAIIHTGHKFTSWLGLALVTAMLLVVVTGVAVRYLLSYVRHEVKEKLALLQTARGDLDSAWGQLENAPRDGWLPPGRGMSTAAVASFGLRVQPPGPMADVIRIADAVADLEYSVRMHELLGRWFAWSLKAHIAVSIAFYGLLALHIVAGLAFGFRWFFLR